MVEIREILCPTDFSEPSRHALEHAVIIASWYDARITGLHVFPVSLFPQPPLLAAGVVEAAAPIVPNYDAQAEALHAWLEPARRAGIRTDAVVDLGNTASKVLEHAHARQTNLIVMGTHGVGGFERLMLGSVTEKVLRKATCPVITVPPAAETAAKVPYTRLLCPVDFSESSEAALRFAFSLAEEADATITILHVVDLPADDDLLMERFDALEFRQVVEAQMLHKLQSLVPDQVRAWCTPVTRLAYGKAYREILAAAEKEQTDLIVMGVRGRSPVDLTLFGSTTNQVVRQARCPVLTLTH